MDSKEFQLKKERDEFYRLAKAKDDELQAYRNSKKSTAKTVLFAKYGNKIWRVKVYALTKMYHALELKNNYKFVYVKNITHVTSAGFECDADVIEINNTTDHTLDLSAFNVNTYSQIIFTHGNETISFDDLYNEPVSLSEVCRIYNEHINTLGKKLSEFGTDKKE